MLLLEIKGIGSGERKTSYQVNLKSGYRLLKLRVNLLFIRVDFSFYFLNCFNSYLDSIIMKNIP